MASSRKKPVKKKPFDFAKRSKASLASLSGKTVDGKRVKPRVRKTVENDETCLHKHAWQWVAREHPSLLIFHVANERKGSIGAAMYFKRMGVLPGVADFLVFPPGNRDYAIELKDDEGEQGPAQMMFQRRWEAAGNVYVIVRTLTDFQAAVTAAVLFG